MSLESAFYTHLVNHTGVAALVATRIYPLVIPQDALLPAIAYQVIDDVPVYAHPAATGNSRARMQLTWQGSYSQVVALRYALQQAMHQFAGAGDVDVQSVQVEAVRDGYAETFERATRRMDVIVWYYDRSLI